MLDSLEKFAWGALVGMFLGIWMAYAFTSTKYVDGRMSACKDLVSVVAQIFPNALGNPECVSYKDDVAIKSSGKLYSLDGKRELN